MAPEQRLMLAVLEDAAHTYRETSASPGAVSRDEVDEWFASNALDWPFSFVNVCQALGLDPDNVRTRVANRRQLLAAA